MSVINMMPQKTLKLLKIITFILTGIALIFVRYRITRPVYKDGDHIQITAKVLRDPMNYSGTQMVKISGLIIYLPKFPLVHYGDKLVIEGVVEKGKIENAVLVQQISGSNFLFDFRQKILDFYQNNLPEPEAGLIAGIVLGSKPSLDRDFYNDTKSTGVAHIVVASGTNVAFISGFLMSFFALFAKRRKLIFIVILNIVLYILLSGMEAPLIRAGIMATAMLISEFFGRTLDLWKIYFSCLFIMLFYSPQYLNDLGFLMSFAVTASIMLFESAFRKRLAFLPKFIKESFSVSLSAWLGATPILLFTLGNINFLSPLTNLLVGFTVPLVMILGSLAAFAGLIYEPIGVIILYLSYPMLWWFTKVVEFFAQ
jgi:competence protein ComEC